MPSARPLRPEAARQHQGISHAVTRWMKSASVLFLALAAWTCATAECRAPAYRTGFVLKDTSSSISMNISIRMNDFAPARLICLAEALRQRYSERREVKILVFSSLAAAKGFKTPTLEGCIGECIDWSVENHAIYSRNADKGEESITIMPLDHRDFCTKVDLPAASIPACTLEVAGRCLLAVNKLTLNYPEVAQRAEYFGSVTLEGVIAGDGKVKNIKTVETPVPRSGAQESLEQAALRSLRTWYFEPARQQDAIRITYDYRIDPSLPLSGGLPVVRFDLPNRVEIRHRPLR